MYGGVGMRTYQLIDSNNKAVSWYEIPAAEMHVCWQCLEVKMCIPIRLKRKDIVKQEKHYCFDCIGFHPETDVPVSGESKSRAKLPTGHKFFGDCLRESQARMIEWAITRKSVTSLFVTLTFRVYVSEKKARKMVNRWLARLNQSLKDKGAGRLRWVCAKEWQERKVIHFHLLLIAEGLEHVSRKSIEARWWNSGGGYARAYDAVLQAAPYLAKYTNKDAAGGLEWGGYWQGQDFPASVECTCSLGDRL